MCRIRPMLYWVQWKLFQQHPLTGIGIGNFVSLNIPLWPEWFKTWIDPFMLPKNGESDYFETLCETGIIGFLLTLVFWFGAFFIGIKQIRRHKELDVYTHTVVVALFLIQAAFSTASRHVPSNILHWLVVGYFWRSHFHRGWVILPARIKTLTGIAGGTIHCIAIALLVQIIAGDTLYLSFRNRASADATKPVRLLRQSLKVCPFHPNALFQTAFIALKAKQFDFAEACLDKCDSAAPYLEPTDFARGVIALNRGDYRSALGYAEKALSLKPNLFDAKMVKLKSLAMLGRCREFHAFRKPLLLQSPLPRQNDSIPAPHRPQINYDSLFILRYGTLRSAMCGTFLRSSFYRIIEHDIILDKDIMRKIQEIGASSCDSIVKL
jgi:hypothetical protein